jgi:hypothetical protein
MGDEFAALPGREWSEWPAACHKDNSRGSPRNPAPSIFLSGDRLTALPHHNIVTAKKI